MIPHQTICIQTEQADRPALFHYFQKMPVILLIHKDLLSIDSPKHYMIYIALTFFPC